MREEKACACDGAKKLVFSCSGAADVGEISDRAARKLNKEGAGKMYCMAGIGGDVDIILKTARAAGAILAIDGCPLNCASRTLTKAGFSDFQTVALAELGMDKGASPATEAAVEIVADKARAALACKTETISKPEGSTA